MPIKVKLTKELKTEKTPWEGIPENWMDYYGFVYCVTNKLSGKKYIGRKFFWKTTRGIISGESDWTTYKTSSNGVLRDLITHGLSIFKFEVLSVHQTRQETEEMEVGTQLTRNVLRTTLSDGTPEYYNNSINSRYYRPKDFGTPEYIAKIEAISQARKKFYAEGGVHPMKGKPHPNKGKKLPQTGHRKNFGRHHSEETKLKLKISSKERKRITCPICNKSMLEHLFIKFHSTCTFVPKKQNLCLHCGNEIIDGKPNQRYCCIECKKKHNYKYVKKGYNPNSARSHKNEEKVST